MMGTINCIYETPCGWCSKWDKECDKKIDIQKESTDIPCINCGHNDWSMPQCKECNVDNGFKYFSSK